MTLQDLLQPLLENFEREARGYAKMAPVPEGDRPHQITSIQLTCGNISGTYRVAAHEVRKIIKKHGHKILTNHETQETETNP